MKLTRAKKREIREAVNKAIAARARTTPLTDALYAFGETSQEILDYASDWRDMVAKGLDRGAETDSPT